MENMRSFEKLDSVELKPITILVGVNNSGKSSFLRSIPLLRQSIKANSTAPVLWYGDYVDFGNFKSAVRKQNPDEEISFCFEVQDLDVQCNFESWPYHDDSSDDERKEYTKSIKFENIKFTMVIGEHNGHTIRKKMLVELTSNEIKTDDCKIKADFHFSETAENKESEYEITKTRINGKNVVSKSDEIAFVYDFTNFFPQIKFAYFLTSSGRKKYYVDDDMMFSKMNEKLQEFAVKNSVLEDNGNIADDTFDIIQYPRISKDLFHEIAKNSISNLLNEMSKKFESDSQIDLLGKIDAYSSLNWVFEAINTAGKLFSNLYEDSSYFRPVRVSGERTYRIQELEVSEIASDGSNLHLFLASLVNKKLETDFANWVGKILKLRIGIDGLRDNSEAVKKSVNTVSVNIESGGLKINVTDSGYGISQILPIMAQLWIVSKKEVRRGNSIFSHNASPNSISGKSLITIEQPELHLHPRHQAKIADAIALTLNDTKSDKSKLQPIFVIESHSESFINRFGDLIEEGEISKDDVQILMFKYDEDNLKTTVEASYFNEEGELDEDWPYGFFEY